MTMREAWRGTGLAIIDGQQPMEERMAKLQAVADENAVQLNLETLFGSIDYCECDDCLSVYSPAAYFVEILQYLRNNNLGPNPTDPTKPNPDIHPGIKGTPLEKLFRRRPDLGCLELTCENTFTVLPYIDLVNEVMESFVVHLDEYETDTHKPKQATLEVFNVDDETTSELLAQPQHINYQAYCILKDAVYPFTLPYHQPIDAIRIFLKYMGTSRYELLDTFRTATEAVSSVVSHTCPAAGTTRAARDGSGPLGRCGVSRHHPGGIHHPDPGGVLAESLFRSHASDSPSPTKSTARRSASGQFTSITATNTEADMLSIDETSKTGSDVREETVLATHRNSVRRSGRAAEDAFHQSRLPTGQGADDIGKHTVQLPLSADAWWIQTAPTGKYALPS